MPEVQRRQPEHPSDLGREVREPVVREDQYLEFGVLPDVLGDFAQLLTPQVQ